MADTPTDRELARLRRDLEWHRRTLDAYEAALHRRTAREAARSVQIEPKFSGGPKTEAIAGSAWSTNPDPSWPAASWPETPLAPSPGFASASLAAGGTTVTAIPVFGRRGGDLEETVAKVGHWQRGSMNFIPVFLTDSASHQSFQRRGHAFEYFPPAAYRTSSGRLDRDRIEARLRLVRRKWNITATIDLSAPADLPGSPASASQVADQDKTGEPSLLSEGARGSGSNRRSRYSQAEIKRLASKIRASGLFDAEWYLGTNPDVARSGIDPIVHYLQSGALEGRDPHPLFRTDYYARQMLGARKTSRGKG